MSVSMTPSEGRERPRMGERSATGLVDPHAVAARLAAWSDEARCHGRLDRADELLAQAWSAYDRPARPAGPNLPNPRRPRG